MYHHKLESEEEEEEECVDNPSIDIEFFVPHSEVRYFEVPEGLVANFLGLELFNFREQSSRKKANLEVQSEIIYFSSDDESPDFERGYEFLPTGTIELPTVRLEPGDEPYLETPSDEETPETSNINSCENENSSQDTNSSNEVPPQPEQFISSESSDTPDSSYSPLPIPSSDVEQIYFQDDDTDDTMYLPYDETLQPNKPAEPESLQERFQRIYRKKKLPKTGFDTLHFSVPLDKWFDTHPIPLQDSQGTTADSPQGTQPPGTVVERDGEKIISLFLDLHFCYEMKPVFILRGPCDARLIGKYYSTRGLTIKRSNRDQK